MSEDTALFWQEVRRSLMVRGDGWKPIIEDLPNHINLAEIKELLQTPDQLTFLNGVGHIAGGRIDTVLDKEAVLPAVSIQAYRSDVLTIENIALQWLYRFIVVEGLVEHNRTKPMA